MRLHTARTRRAANDVNPGYWFSVGMVYWFSVVAAVVNWKKYIFSQILVH